MRDEKFTENSILTYTGKIFDLKLMEHDSICIEDIAHSLSHTFRFGGHLSKPYNVAQHSVLVANMVDNEYKLEALLHDASEAYIGDMPSPFKKMMPEYMEIESKLMKVVSEVFGFNFPMSKEVKIADKEALILEWEAFIENKIIMPCWTPEVSKEEFIKLYNQVKK